MENESNGKLAPRRMARDNFFKLCLWVQSQSERLQNERPKLAALASQAERELGFTVTRQQAGDAKKTTGQTWVSCNSSREGKTSKFKLLMERIEHLENVCGFLCRRSGLDFNKIP